jgi:hypothetical protein
MAAARARFTPSFYNSYKINIALHCEQAVDRYAKIASDDSALADNIRIAEVDR